MKEKSQFEKNAADKQVELLSGALSGAVSAGGQRGRPLAQCHRKGISQVLSGRRGGQSVQRPVHGSALGQARMQEQPLHLI